MRARAVTAGKTVEESATEMVQVALPNDANPLGHLLGGTVMDWIDMVGAVAATRHSRRPVVTASMARLDFRSPIKVGHLVILKARLHGVGRTSMEIGVDVFCEDPMTGKRAQTSSALLTFVALDEHGRPASVPRLSPRTAEDRRRAAEFEARRQRRKGDA